MCGRAACSLAPDVVYQVIEHFFSLFVFPLNFLVFRQLMLQVNGETKKDTFPVIIVLLGPFYQLWLELEREEQVVPQRG